MNGEKNLDILLKTMKPELHQGEYVFCTVSDTFAIPFAAIQMMFKEKEGITLVLKKELADSLQLSYSFIAAWISLTIHSSLEAVGLTAAFSAALSKHNISCNVVAAYYHDHIFVDIKDASKTIKVLEELSNA